MRFLLRWQFVVPGLQREGRRGLLAVIAQLQGFELAAGAWEPSVLRARVAGYRPEWLDELCLGGEVAWARLGLPSAVSDETGPSASPSRATPLGFALRDELAWLLKAAREQGRPTEPTTGTAASVLAELRGSGALFAAELAARAECSEAEADAALFDLVSRGLVVADGFGALRTLLDRRVPRRSRVGTRRGAGRRGAARGGLPGRFALLPEPSEVLDREALCEVVAEQLLARWGVVFRDLLARESLALPWRDVLRAFRRIEARGTARGGRFVTGFAGEQFALPGAVEALRSSRRQPRTGERVELSAADPLNLVGILTPGPRVPALRGHVVAYVDGALEESEVATAS
jgi:ATP-dependent Lhr-like helicase